MAAHVGQREVNFAYYLLKDLHANVSNPYLILAVIAWIRRSHGNWDSNNPLLIIPGSYDKRYRVGTNKFGFSVYRNIADAAAATAAKIIGNGALRKWIVPAARRTASGDKDMAQQAQDFLLGIAISPWAQDHYGLGHDPESLDQATALADDDLIKVWLTLTGAHFTLPGTQGKPPPPTKPRKRPIPPQPKSFVVPARLHYPFIQPYAARDWYEARQREPQVLPDELL